MFTGVIEKSGKFLSLQSRGKSFDLKIQARSIFKNVKKGDSVAVNGICLSVAAKQSGVLTFNVLSETLRRTALNRIQAGEFMNLELPLRWGQKINGHFISGHVDTTATLTQIKPEKSGKLYRFKLKDKKLSKLIAQKGSVAIDGISLTVVKKTGDQFWVALIPLTLKWTNLGHKKTGDTVNIEADLIARYAQGKKSKIRLK